MNTSCMWLFITRYRRWMQLKERCWETSNREVIYKYLKGLVRNVGQRHVLSFGDRHVPVLSARLILCVRMYHKLEIHLSPTSQNGDNFVFHSSPHSESFPFVDHMPRRWHVTCLKWNKSVGTAFNYPNPSSFTAQGSL